MSYKCEILADSLSPQGHRLTTFKVTYPRIIHAEMCRHRILSRNTASSRAIPFEKMVKDVQENPFVPLAFQRDHKGMQGTEYLQGEDAKWSYHLWERAKESAVQSAKVLASNTTKQLCNRLLEPFVWTTELVSGTEWENFFELRCPKYWTSDSGPYHKSWKDLYDEYNKLGSIPDEYVGKENDELFRIQKSESQAEIHIQKITEMMWDCYNKNKPKALQTGEWHIPYGDNIDYENLFENIGYEDRDARDSLSVKIATARAARISYTTLGDIPKIDYEADIKLHDRLLESKHASPFEHIAQCRNNSTNYANFIGWESYRSILNL